MRVEAEEIPVWTAFLIQNDILSQVWKNLNPGEVRTRGGAEAQNCALHIWEENEFLNTEAEAYVEI